VVVVVVVVVVTYIMGWPNDCIKSETCSDLL
jgi:hypothetical protein